MLHPGIDIVPLVAMATLYCPPVAIVNHADHLFWIGCSVADAIIDLRSIGSILTERRRSTPLDLLLPIPLTDVPPPDCHSLARKRIGIPEDQVVLVTVGRAEKYLPYQDTSFVRTGLQILEDNPRAHLYIVGVSRGFAETRLANPRHDRLHFLGYVEDPSSYQQAADVYLESFPFGSQTALLEAGFAGVPSVRSYNPPVQWLTANDDAINSLMSVPATEEEYIAEASRLIRDAEARNIIGRELRENMLSMHTGSGWLRQLHKVYDTLRTVRHTPRSIPAMRAVLDSVDIALSSWQESQHPRSWEPLEAFEKYTRSGDAQSSLASPQMNYAMSLSRMCEALQRHDFRTSRGASWELFRIYKRWIDSVLHGMEPGARQNILIKLQLGISARLKWARWKRDWVTYEELRRYVSQTWPRTEQVGELASEKALPRFLYWLWDAWNRMRTR
jgi:hypothetical protein